MTYHCPPLTRWSLIFVGCGGKGRGSSLLERVSLWSWEFLSCIIFFLNHDLKLHFNLENYLFFHGKCVIIFYQVHLHLKIMLIFICLFIFEKKTFIWFRCISWNIDRWMCIISWNPRKIHLNVIFISSALINYHNNAPDNPYVTWQFMIDQKSSWHIWGEMNTCHCLYQFFFFLNVTISSTLKIVTRQDSVLIYY